MTRREHTIRRHKDHRRTGWFDVFPDEVVEVNVVKIEPRASAGSWHLHQHQDDWWFVADGRLFVATTEDGKARKFSQLRTGDNPKHIPAGIWHTYKNRSDEPVLLIYGLTNHYDPDDPDEERMDFSREDAEVLG